MQYLFFDIECCDGCHICSFGYVLTDEKFNILEKKDIVINPEKPFGMGRDGFDPSKNLSYTEGVFLRAPNFTQAYKTIFDLLLQSGQKIVGHSVSSDFNYLRRACERYEMPLPNLDFYDTQILFALINNIPTKKRSMKNIIESLGLVINLSQHKSDDDADVVREILNRLCLNTNKTALELFDMYYQCRGFTKNGMVYVYDDKSKRPSEDDRAKDFIENHRLVKIVSVPSGEDGELVYSSDKESKGTSLGDLFKSMGFKLDDKS